MASQTSLHVSEVLMKEACEKSWKEVNKNQAALNSHSNQCRPVGDSQNAMSVISEMKAKCIKGEIDALKEKQIEVLPNDPVILDSVLKEQLESSVSQLEECLAVVEGRRRELEDDLARQQELLAQHQEMKRVLESRLREAEQGDNRPTRPTEDSQVKALKRKQKRAGEIQNQLLKQIGDFVGKHYPTPTQAGKRNAQEEPHIKYSSLLEIIELLMNKGIDGELDPYVPINEVFWPPYVELLLRCGIASRHPQDSNRIRLVPAYL